MRYRLEGWLESEPSEDAGNLAALVGDLCARSIELEEAESWTAGG